MMGYTANLKTGILRAHRSPGFTANWADGLGLRRRFAAGVAKGVNFALTPFCPIGIRTELIQRAFVMRPEITPERLQVAKDFFEAFANPPALSFVKAMMVRNYSDAIMTHHPNKETLDRGEIQKKCEVLIRTIFRRLEDIKRHPQFLYDAMKSMSRGVAPREAIWFAEYQDAYQKYKHVDKLGKRDDILFPHVVGDSLVDIGCGGGDQVAYLKSNHSDQLQSVAGIDVLAWKTPGLDIDYHTLDFSQPGTVAPERYDTGMLLAVLHHAGKSDQEFATFLDGVKTAVNRRLIVEEDVLVTPEDLRRTDIPGLEEIYARREEQLNLDEYLELDPASQRAAMVIVDLLGNSLSVGVPDMPFPFGFRSLSNWVDTFTANGLKLDKVKVLGFQEGNFHQVCHVLFILDCPA